MSTKTTPYRKDRLPNLIEYLLLSLMAVSIPISWNFSIKVMVALLIVMLCKQPWKKGWGNKARNSWTNAGLKLEIGYFFLCLISLAYTQNMHEGWFNLNKKLPFLLFGIYFLFSDLSYMKKIHVNTLLFLFSGALLSRFIIRLIKFIPSIHSFNSLLSPSFDPIHHAYLSMYTLLALVFVYWKLGEWKHLSATYRVFLATCGICMILYTLFVQSRAGVLCMILLMIGMLLHTLFIRKQKRLGILAVSLLILGAGATMLSPNGNHRLTKTAKEISSGDHSDIRLEIWSNAIGTIGENLPFGVGIGDRFDAIASNYPDSTSGSQLNRDRILNPHNQYLDTTLSIGIPGILVLLAMLILPFVQYLKRGKSSFYAEYMLPFLAIIILSCPFESIFERQMGVLFFCFFYGLFLLQPNREISTANSTEEA